MPNVFEFVAELRSERGKGRVRRLRKMNRVPAIIYGRGADPLAVTLDHNEVVKSLDNEAVYSHVLSLKVDGRDEKAILKAIQRHPSKPIILHLDFQRVSETERIRVHVPLHFVNQEISVGVKKGGVVMHNMVDIEVICLPDKLPEYIEVDLANIDLGQTVHLSDLPVPQGVDIAVLLQGAEHDLPVAVMQATRAAESAENVEE
jgi:large subunit ribosomal protein L25